jgi:hypothetical protein
MLDFINILKNVILKQKIVFLRHFNKLLLISKTQLKIVVKIFQIDTLEKFARLDIKVTLMSLFCPKMQN